MKFLIDNMLSVLLSPALSAFGHDAVHVRDLHMAAQPDVVLLNHAASEGRVVISADRDFGTLLAELRLKQPSVIYVKGEVVRDPGALAHLICDNLPRLKQPLDDGAIIVIEPGRIRIRMLPIV